MAMLGIHFMKDVPFRDVYLHAIVRDAEGQKLSKSKGNVADPLVVMEKYGTDAFRFTLAALAQGRDIRISEERIEGYRNFANKLWNASRLVLSNLSGFDPALAKKTPPELADVWIESRLAATIAEVRTALRRYRFSDAASALYQFLWHELCDWYLEIAKLSLYHAENPGQRARTQATLVRVLETTLRLLHPFMPFITEEIWQRLPHKGESIMLAPYPRLPKKDRKPDAERQMSAVMDLVTAVRNIRGEMRIAPAASLAATLRPGPDAGELFTANGALIDALGRVRLTIDPAATRPRSSAMAVIGGSELYVDLTGVVDLAAERRPGRACWPRSSFGRGFRRRSWPRCPSRPPSPLPKRCGASLASRPSSSGRTTCSSGAGRSRESSSSLGRQHEPRRAARLRPGSRRSSRSSASASISVSASSRPIWRTAPPRSPSRRAMRGAVRRCSRRCWKSSIPGARASRAKDSARFAKDGGGSATLSGGESRSTP